jgi:hypothetical protein
MSGLKIQQSPFVLLLLQMILMMKMMIKMMETMLEMVSSSTLPTASSSSGPSLSSLLRSKFSTPSAPRTEASSAQISDLSLMDPFSYFELLVRMILEVEDSYTPVVSMVSRMVSYFNDKIAAFKTKDEVWMIIRNQIRTHLFSKNSISLKNILHRVYLQSQEILEMDLFLRCRHEVESELSQCVQIAARCCDGLQDSEETPQIIENLIIAMIKTLVEKKRNKRRAVNFHIKNLSAKPIALECPNKLCNTCPMGNPCDNARSATPRCDNKLCNNCPMGNPCDNARSATPRCDNKLCNNCPMGRSCDNARSASPRCDNKLCNNCPMGRPCAVASPCNAPEKLCNKCPYGEPCEFPPQ